MNQDQVHLAVAQEQARAEQRSGTLGYYVPEESESVFSFMDDHCGGCVHDKNEDCPHLAAALRGEVRVWMMDAATGRTFCTEHRLPGETPRCPKTMELPL